MSTQAAELPGDGLPPVVHPWEDAEKILRHAQRAVAHGDKVRAAALFARVIELNPNEARGWSGYAGATPNVDEAIVSWGYALALAPEHREARAELDALVEEKVKNSMLAQIDNPSLAASFVALGRALAEAGQRAWAYRLLVRATQLDSANEHAWIWRAGVTEDLNETITCLNQAIQLDPHSARAHAGLRWAQTRQSTVPASRTAAERAAQWVEDAQRALHDGDNEHAYELLKNASELDPQNAMAWFWRGSVAEQVDEALQCMEQALALNPHSEAAKDAVWWLRIRKLRERARAQAHVFATSASASFPRVAKAAPPPEPSPPPARQWMILGAGIAIVLALLLLLLVWR